MLALTWSTIRARGRQAITVLLLAAAAVGAAVASSVYVDAARQRVLADDVASATAAEQSITVAAQARFAADNDSQVEQTQLANTRQKAFAETAPDLLRLDGFTTISAAGYPAYAADQPWHEGQDQINAVIEFRENACDQVIILEGRCLSGPGEALVTPTWAAAGFGVSHTVVSTPVKRIIPRDFTPPFLIPVGKPSPLVVVGVYQPLDPTAAYWGRSTANPLNLPVEPLLVDRPTLEATDHQEEFQTVTAYARPGTFRLDRVGAVRSDVDHVLSAASELGAGSSVVTLLDRIDRDSRTVGLVAGVATAPLIAVCWYVLFLAIAYTVQGRRVELGMAKLRGMSTSDQWWLVTAESFVPMLAGAVIGYLLGHVAVAIYARIAFGPAATVALTARPVPFAAIALAGAVLASLVAMRRDLGSTATDLMRRVPSLRRGWRGLTLSALVCAVAALAVVQLRSTPPAQGSAGQAGLGRFAPALLIVGLGLLSAVLVDPIMGWIGGRALRRGRLAVALAGLHIGRRGSGSRLLSLVVVAVGLLTFAVTASQFAAAERTRATGATVGADQVLTVSTISPSTLLNAVRSVDPAGDFAMAAQPIVTGGAPLLAVDAPRLPKVAVWPDSAMTAPAAASALHPELPTPIEIHGTGLAVSARLTATALPVKYPITLHVIVARLSTSEILRYTLSPPASPGAPYTTDVACAAGCRLVKVQVSGPPERPGFEVFSLAYADPEITIEAIRQTGPAREVASAAELARFQTKAISAAQLQSTGTGLKVTLTAYVEGGVSILPPDAPNEVTVLDAGDAGLFTLPFNDGLQVLGVVATVKRLPRIGTRGAFTDLEYVLRSGDPQVAGSTAEVWLGPDAPADTAQRLTAAGVHIIATQRLSDELAAAAIRPAAVGLRFLLIAALAGVLLGAAGLVVAAGVERRTRADELRALRVQGLGSGAVVGSALIGYVVPVAIAAVLGFVAGLAVWQATGAYLPILDQTGAVASLPLRPDRQTLIAGGFGAAALIVVAAVIAIVLTRSSKPGARAERTSS